MQPLIEKTKFGSISINGDKYKNDIVIRLNGKIKKRKKDLSKRIFGTSHMVSLEEAEHIYDKGAERLIIGSGQEGKVKLSPEAAEYFLGKTCQVELLPTPQAILAWNEADGAVIAMFHVTD